MPGVMGFLSALKQSQAGTAGSAMTFVGFGSASALISISVIVSTIIGIEFYFLIISGLSIIAFFWVLRTIIIQLENSKVQM